MESGGGGGGRAGPGSVNEHSEPLVGVQSGGVASGSSGEQKC